MFDGAHFLEEEEDDDDVEEFTLFSAPSRGVSHATVVADVVVVVLVVDDDDDDDDVDDDCTPSCTSLGFEAVVDSKSLATAFLSSGRSSA